MESLKFILPRITTAQRDAIAAPGTGETIYNTSTETIQVYTGATWVEATDGTGGGGDLTFADVWAINTLINC